MFLRTFCIFFSWTKLASAWKGLNNIYLQLSHSLPDFIKLSCHGHVVPIAVFVQLLRQGTMKGVYSVPCGVGIIRAFSQFPVVSLTVYFSVCDPS